MGFSLRGKTSLFGGKRVFSVANESFRGKTSRTTFLTFTIVSLCLHPLLHPLEPEALPAKSGSTYNHPSHVTELGQSAEKVGNVERLNSRQPLARLFTLLQDQPQTPIERVVFWSEHVFRQKEARRSDPDIWLSTNAL